MNKLKPLTALALVLLLISALVLHWSTEAQDNSKPLDVQLQERIDAAFAAGGGLVSLPAGEIEVRAPIRLYSRVRLVGKGRNISTIRLADNVKLADGEAVVMTDRFPSAIDRNLWSYRHGKVTGTHPTFDEADGLHAGFGLESLTIDGNARGHAKAGGLHVYGGSYKICDVGIMDVSGNGLWSQCGRTGNSIAGDAVYNYANMHESIIEHVYISRAGGHGLLYQGPNDSYVNHVQVKMPGGSCFRFESNTEAFASGGVQIGKIHGYSPQGQEHTYIGSSVMADLIYVDTPRRDGLVVDGAGSMINQVVVFQHNVRRDNPGWGCLIHGNANRISQLRYSGEELSANMGQHGGALKIAGDNNEVVGYLYGGGHNVKTKGHPTEITGKGSNFGGKTLGWE